MVGRYTRYAALTDHIGVKIAAGIAGMIFF